MQPAKGSLWGLEGQYNHLVIRLVTPLEFEALPDGTILTAIDGERRAKGKDEIDLDTRMGFTAWGLTGEGDMNEWEDVPDPYDYLPPIVAETPYVDPDVAEAAARWDERLNVPRDPRTQQEIDDQILAVYEGLDPGQVVAGGPYKINAIKTCRELMNLGLKEAKDYVERLIGDFPPKYGLPTDYNGSNP